MDYYATTTKLLREIETKLESVPKNEDDLTYFNFWDWLQSHHYYLQDRRKELEIQFKQDSARFNEQTIAKEKKEKFNDFERMVNNSIVNIKRDVSSLTEKKYKKLQNMILTPPTQTQAQLLAALSMRKNITVLELQRIAGAYFDNYQAIQVLTDIAHVNGVNIHLPIQYDIEQIISLIEKADKFLKGAVDFVAYEINTMPQQYHAFYTYNPDEPGHIYDPEYEQIVYNLDNVPQLQDVKYTKTSLTNTEKTRIDDMFRDIKNTDTNDPKTVKGVKDIINKYPDDIRLMKLSKHGGIVNEVLEIMKEEAKK